MCSKEDIINNIQTLPFEELEKIYNLSREEFLRRKAKDNVSEMISNSKLTKSLKDMLMNMEIKKLDVQENVDSYSNKAIVNLKNLSLSISWNASIWTKHGLKWRRDEVKIITIEDNNEEFELFSLDFYYNDFENESDFDYNSFIVVEEWLKNNCNQTLPDDEEEKIEIIQEVLSILLSIIAGNDIYKLNSVWND